MELTSSYNSSPHRYLSKSYPPQRATLRGVGASADIKLADLMDEDEALWMSNLESSRAVTPVQGATSNSKTNDHLQTPPRAELSRSRNMTPPLPPLDHIRHSPTAWKSKHSNQLSVSSSGLTALPQRPKTLYAPTFAQRVFLAGKSNLLYNYTEHSLLPWHKPLTRGAIDVTTLQKMQKYVVQQKLVAQVRALGERECWLEIGIGQTIHEYCQILQDLEYMEKHAAQGMHHDPFLITTRRPLEAQLLQEAGLARQTPGARSARHAVDPIRHTRRGSPCLIMVRRLAVMLAIAAAVLLPCLVATLTSGYLVRVIVVCACSVAFAGAAAIVKGIQPLQAMLLTMLYAAALIVFIGSTPARFAR